MSVVQASLPVIDKSDGTPGTAAPAIAIQVGGTDGTSLRALHTDASGNLLVSSRVLETPASPTAASVGVASAQIVAFNANRKGLVLVNTSAAKISLGFGVAAVLNSGITLLPGGVFVMDEFMFTVDSVTAIASVAASNVGIQEYS